MADKRIVVCRNLAEVIARPTAHNIGFKQVLLANDETLSNVTQIAKTMLKAGECVESHVHPTMDEHYLFLSGDGVMHVGDTIYRCKEGLFILIPANTAHDLRAITDLKMITIGVAL